MNMNRKCFVNRKLDIFVFVVLAVLLAAYVFIVFVINSDPAVGFKLLRRDEIEESFKSPYDNKVIKAYRVETDPFSPDDVILICYSGDGERGLYHAPYYDLAVKWSSANTVEIKNSYEDDDGKEVADCLELDVRTDCYDAFTDEGEIQSKEGWGFSVWDYLKIPCILVLIGTLYVVLGLYWQRHKEHHTGLLVESDGE